MAKRFGENEHRICSLFNEGETFEYKGNIYVVVFSDKPVCRSGEPKTDIFVRTHLYDNPNVIRDFKISYKQDNADFIENKTSAERAEQLLGVDWQEIIEHSTLQLREVFENRPLIYASKYKKTEAGAITLGWKFELLRVKSGELSEIMQLNYDQKVDVYAGTNLPVDKRDASVCGMIIKDSGIAEFIFEEIEPVFSAQEVVDRMQTIDEFLEEYPNIYYACKALNYRSFKDKYDGDRPLSVFVDWNVIDGKLVPELVFDRPLVTKGTAVYEQLMYSMDLLGISNTDDIIENQLADESIVWF